MQPATRKGFVNAAPLLKKEGNIFFAAKAQDVFNPVLLHRAGTSPALPADNRPVYARKIESPKILQ